MSESDKYDLLEKIGHGSFGIIRKVRRKADGMILCRKEISYLKMSQKEREQLHAEFSILSTLRHPNIVGYYHREHLKATQDLHLYMEYCGNGDLGRVIRNLIKNNQYAEESFVWSIFAQLVSALYRCHYGVDPPEVGKTVLGLGATAKPKPPSSGTTILHRDLKPENVFLGEDNSVKLGDFGLSKVMSSHDFASTYVGTPFYMSPEICAAEKYTLKSDIWSLGCIIYELCAREPPFNAKTHYQLVQKIKDGKVAPLPSVYSGELFATIKDCLRVNPDRRPDTATLLNLPIVRLMRKEKEVVEFSRTLRTKEETLNKRIRELDSKLSALETEKSSIRAEIDASLRREWEVKARLEIDRLVAQEIESLQQKFEQEVQARVEAELQRYGRGLMFNSHGQQGSFSSTAATLVSDFNQSSVGSGDGDFPSTTDITDFSIAGSTDGFDVTKKIPRTPFHRAQTYSSAPAESVLGTPMDIEMASPSPITIASLSLSPRRMALTKAPTTQPRMIFGGEPTPREKSNWDVPRETDMMDSGDESEAEALVPSPKPVAKSSKNPFSTLITKSRPSLNSQQNSNPLPIHGLRSKQTLATRSKTVSGVPSIGQHPLRSAPSAPALRDRKPSPTRRHSRIPSVTGVGRRLSANNNNNNSGSDTASSTITSNITVRTRGLKRMSSTCDESSFSQQSNQPHQPLPQAPPLKKIGLTATKNIRGSSLVELHQARAGGRPISAIMSNEAKLRAFKEHATIAASDSRSTTSSLLPTRPRSQPQPITANFEQQQLSNTNSTSSSNSAGSGSATGTGTGTGTGAGAGAGPKSIPWPVAPVWNDPEEMPSPFIVKTSKKPASFEKPASFVRPASNLSHQS
ncbi:kinase-like domain-containing protein [Pseudoneurospora amorphoporcata]|uniref:non-specific serine/threonine protein kinase n=1 Tax=Pseudoneurospora amorphoporcata TaxID=241081 RepID=A0AAN6P216_9PEZI|nr:kinase-like domain-containing protein [Pseudoneurospora amorphoporcata]